jgi:7,8-dihydro-6-hydroxymethylpterin-pyrophosphokinase
LENKENLLQSSCISVWPVGQHKRPFQLLPFTASVTNAIRPCQVAMSNKLVALAQLQRHFSLNSRSKVQGGRVINRGAAYAALYRNAAWYKNTDRPYNNAHATVVTTEQSH